MLRRHLTTAVTLLVLCGILVVALVVGYHALFAPIDTTSEPDASASPTCSTHTVVKKHRLRTKDIRVSVYNGGHRSGLAGDTMGGLVKRGFRRGEVGNAPNSVKLRFVQVWTTIKDDPAAKLVGEQFGKTTLIKVRKKSLGPGIDVIVGNDFRGLKKAPKSIEFTQKEKVCTGASSSPSSDGSEG
ncbi:MAG TPA: LytR C-terminal domain-containing protein [Pedococcus sp.]|nr:LytR C-terminal domain-containing protein [Nocardioidaceae bacterium]HEX5428848.1 LytR C-terminal domain-containing protein [Pedococcus sp.]